MFVVSTLRPAEEECCNCQGLMFGAEQAAPQRISELRKAALEESLVLMEVAISPAPL